jgi:hypothetical protein
MTHCAHTSAVGTPSSIRFWQRFRGLVRMWFGDKPSVANSLTSSTPRSAPPSIRAAAEVLALCKARCFGPRGRTPGNSACNTQHVVCHSSAEDSGRPERRTILHQPRRSTYRQTDAPDAIGLSNACRSRCPCVSVGSTATARRTKPARAQNRMGCVVIRPVAHRTTGRRTQASTRLKKGRRSSSH